MAGPIKLELDHAEMTGDHGVEWGMTFEEVLGSAGSATIIVQDRNNDLFPTAHMDVKASIRSGPHAGHVLFRGEVVSVKLGFVVGKPWRAWRLECADYNGEFSQRLIGALDGTHWEDVDGLGDYVNFDPNADSRPTDKLTVQHWLDAYIRVDGQAFGTATYVNEYIPDLPTRAPDYSTLQDALEELASEVAANLQFWADPDLEFHWVAIPSWQDVLPQITATGGDPNSTESVSALLPEIGVSDLPAAPYRVSDSRDTGDPTQIGCDQLSLDFDGSEMPEQLYVRGGTGYTYEAPPIAAGGGTKVINPQGYGTRTTETLKLTFLSSTTVWARSATTGLITGSGGTASGGPYDVRFVRVPWNPANGKGGHFWKLISGPYAGLYVDNDTNYFGYGEIKVEKVVTVIPEPKVGIGGSGWVGEVTQDKNKRQAYLDAPVSTTHALRDQIGGQALYRASAPTLRGSMKVNGKALADGSRVSADGFRVGQIIAVEDARLPAALNGQSFVVQRVKSSMIEGTDVREYTLDFGDGPTSRYTYQPRKVDDVRWPPPAIRVDILTRDLSPGPNSSQVILGQLMAKAGGPWEIEGKIVKWSLEVYNSAGTIVTGQGKLEPQASATDKHGRARTTLTTGATTGLVYYVFADVPVED